MKAKKLDDVLVYRKSVTLGDEISAILERPVFSKDLELKDQLSRSSGRVAPLIAEGCGQNTDRQMADYYGALVVLLSSPTDIWPRPPAGSSSRTLNALTWEPGAWKSARC